LIFGMLLCGLLLSAFPAYAQKEAGSGALSDIIRQKLSAAQTQEQKTMSVGACQIEAVKILPKLYQRRAYQPLWQDRQRVAELMAAIDATYLDGLNPADFHQVELKKLITKPAVTGPMGQGQASTLDIVLTDAFVIFAKYYLLGKEDPKSHHPEWNFERRIDDVDPLDFLERSIVAPSPAATIESWKIKHPFYLNLKAALAQYRGILSQGGWESIHAGSTLKISMRDAQVTALRKRLAVTDNAPLNVADPDYFDEPLQAALKRFQNRHGLDPDGVAGKTTLAELNVPVRVRIDQIRVNLERCRWVLRDMGKKFVLVDIAGYRVYMQDNGKTIWTCKAQVGKPYRNTPVFKSAITYIELNPTWTIPPGILVKDTLPAIKRDPQYLKKKNIMVLDAKGMEVNPRSINWSKYPPQSFPYTLRQKPGPDNALGRIKIMFPNPYAVYLHDTPHQELFEKSQRAFSSGCIRLEKPFELAELLLDDVQNWSRPKTLKALETGKTQRIDLPRPVSVLLLYWTVQVDDKGIVYFKSDPYNRDREVLAALGTLG
jgi:L,D-transpeptidase YcbB